MRNINFQRVGARNFCCYKDEMDYSFENNKVILITGPNGSGKSTIFDIIPFTFWGITTKDLRAEDVVNNEVGKNCYTFVEFNIGDDQYKVERYVKDSKLANTVILSKNNIATKRGHREVSAEIDTLLMPQKLFMNTLLFGQKVKNFFTDLTDSEQKDIFRKVLQLDEYELYYKKTTEKIKEVESEISRKDIEIEITENLVFELNEQYEQLVISKNEFEEKKKFQIEQLSTEYNSITKAKQIALDILRDKYSNDFDEELRIIRDLLSNVTSEFNSIKKEEESKINDIQQKSNLKESELRSKADQNRSNIEKKFNEEKSKKASELNSQEMEFQKKISEVTSKLNVIQSIVTSKESNLKKLQNEMTKIKDSLNKDEVICPLCKQPVGVSSIDHLKKELKSKEVESEEIKMDLISVSTDVRNLLQEKGSLDSLVRVLRVDFTTEIADLEKECNDKILANNKKLSDVLTQLKEIVRRDIEKIKLESMETSGKLKLDISMYEEQIKDLNVKINSKKEIEGKIVILDSRLYTIDALKSDAQNSKYDDTVLLKTLESKKEYENKIKTIIMEKEGLTKKLNSLDFWKSGFSMSGIPSMLIDEAIPFMNQRVMFYLEKIGGRYIVSFDTMATTKAGEFRDKISVNVLDTQTKANMRKQLSGGQTRVVDIATILTLRDLQSNIQGISTNIILLDEIFDSLDDQNISYVSGLIRQLAKGQSTHIISHRQIDQIDADEIFTTFN